MKRTTSEWASYLWRHSVDNHTPFGFGLSQQELTEAALVKTLLVALTRPQGYAVKAYLKAFRLNKECGKPDHIQGAFRAARLRVRGFAEAQMEPISICCESVCYDCESN